MKLLRDPKCKTRIDKFRSRAFFFWKILFVSFSAIQALTLLSESRNHDAMLEPFHLGMDIDAGYSFSDSPMNLGNYRKNLLNEVLSTSKDSINATLNEEKRMDAEPSEKNDKRHFCKKEYSSFCPQGWEEHMQHNRPVCIAPASYTGPCSTILSALLTKDQKTSYEEDCHVSWPCMDYCERDYNQLCPLNWDETPDKLCKASLTYGDHCERLKDFTYFTPELKAAWSKSCNILWPCRSKCLQDFTAPCPSEWTVRKALDGGFTCASPSFYSGPCGPEEAITNFDIQLKQTFAERCSVEFPCQKQKCQKDYQILCPDSWIAIVEDGSCEAPDTYMGFCDTRLFPMTFTTEEKMAHEVTCHVEWPCLEPCVPNYTLPCPEFWEERNLKRIPGSNEVHGECYPLSSYKGPCHGPKRLWDKTLEMKSSFAKVCQAPWMCKDTLNGMQKTAMKNSATGSHPLLRLNGPVSPHTGHITAA